MAGGNARGNRRVSQAEVAHIVHQIFDGATWLNVFYRIILPLSRPVMITAALLMFLSQWDSFFWPLLVAPKPELRVVQVEISNAVGEYQTLWNELLAGSMLAAVVPIMLVLPFQRYFVQAITSKTKLWLEPQL